MDARSSFRFVRSATLVLSVQIVAFAQVPQPPRDPTAVVSGGGILRGRVVAAQGGQPLHRVRLTLEGVAQNPPTTVTDLRGEFGFTGVQAGTYRLTATRAGYLTLQYGTAAAARDRTPDQHRTRTAGRRGADRHAPGRCAVGPGR